jgi:hypothetical protein
MLSQPTGESEVSSSIIFSNKVSRPLSTEPPHNMQPILLCLVFVLAMTMTYAFMFAFLGPKHVAVVIRHGPHSTVSAYK